MRIKTTHVLWAVQGLLAVAFLFAGGMKLVMPIEAVAEQTPLPGVLLRLIGLAEVCGALGLVLPGILRVRTELTVAAAVGLVLMMAGATGYTLAGPMAETAPITAVIALLAAAVAYGRSRRPVAARQVERTVGAPVELPIAA